MSFNGSGWNARLKLPAACIELSPVSDTSCLLSSLIYLINRQYSCGKCLNPVTIQYLQTPGGMSYITVYCPVPHPSLPLPPPPTPVPLVFSHSLRCRTRAAGRQTLNSKQNIDIWYYIACYPTATSRRHFFVFLYHVYCVHQSVIWLRWWVGITSLAGRGGVGEWMGRGLC